MYQVTQVCAVCGVESEHSVIGSTNSFGPPDLDMRPAPMARWNLSEEIQCCPQCGYCARDISEATKTANEVVSTNAYQAQLEEDSLCETSRYYLCWASILAAEGELASAGWAALGAAWAADDIDDMKARAEERSSNSETEAGKILEHIAPLDPEAACRCRRLAIGYWQEARERGGAIADDRPTESALLADLYRRVGDFETAQAAARAGIDARAEGVVFDILNFQLGLIDAEDRGCHTLGEIGQEGEHTIYL
jgi:hypothetical protein